MEPETIMQLAYATAARMNVPWRTFEDAAGTAMEAGVRACASFNSTRTNGTERSWVILNMRWAIRSWQRSEMRIPTQEFKPTDEPAIDPVGLHAEMLALEERLEKLEKLTAFVVVAVASGWRMADISKAAHLNANQIKRLNRQGLDFIKSKE